MDELILGLKKIYVLLDDVERRALRSIEATPSQVGLLRAVASHPKGLTVTALSRELLCSRGNATRMVRRLEEQGLLATSGHDRDQRLVLVQLTPTGRRLLTQASTALSQIYLQLSEHLPKEFLVQMQPLTDGLVAALERRLAQAPLERVLSAAGGPLSSD